MKTIKFIVTILAIITICASCNNPQSVAFIISTLNQTVTLYSETDSVCLYPYQKTYLCDIIVEDEEFIAYTGNTWAFDIFEPIERIKLHDTMYYVSEEHRMFLANVTNYTHYTSIINVSSSVARIEGSYYEYYLTADFIDKIIRAANE